GEPGDPAFTISSAHSHGVAVADEPIAYSIMPQNSGKDYKARRVEVAQPVMAGGPVGGNQGGDYIVDKAEPFTLAIRGRGGEPDIEYRQDGTANAVPTPNGGRAGIGVGAIAFAQNQR